MREFETETAYTIKVLSLNKGTEGTVLNFAWLSSQGISPDAFIKLVEKGIVNVNDLKLSPAYLRIFEHERDVKLQMLERKHIAAKSSSQSLDPNSLPSKRAVIFADYPLDAFLGNEGYENLKRNGVLPLDIQAFKSIRKNYVPHLDEFISFQISIPETSLTWLDQYIEDFYVDQVVANHDVFSFDIMRQDILGLLVHKISSGLSKTSLNITSVDIWGRDIGKLYRIKLFETLMAMEKDGSIKILDLSNADKGIGLLKGMGLSPIRVVFSSDDIANYPDAARISVIELSAIRSKQPALETETKTTEQTIDNGSTKVTPILVVEKNIGYIKLHKQGTKIKIGHPGTRKYRLLANLADPLGVARTVETVFEAIVIPMDAEDSKLSDPYLAKPQQLKIIQLTVKELQKIDGLKGRITLKTYSNGKTVALFIE